MITWTTLILWYLYDIEMRLIIVHGFMNNIYHNSSYMINIDHAMKACWSCSATVDHCHERLLIMHHTCWSLPWKTVDHTWSLICIIVDHVSQLLIMSMKHCWSYMINIDHCHGSLLIMYHNCWSCIISWSLMARLDLANCIFWHIMICKTCCSQSLRDHQRSYLIFVISFTQAGFSKTKFYT